MSLRKLFVTVGAVWAPPLAVSTAAVVVVIVIATERFLQGYVPFMFVLTLIAVCALVAFAGSIYLGNRFGKRFARKEPLSWAANVGALLIVLGVVANVAVMVGFFNLPMLHDDEVPFEYLTEETARQPAGE